LPVPLHGHLTTQPKTSFYFFFAVNPEATLDFSNKLGYNTISLGDDMVAKLEKLFKALGDKNRLRIINMLAAKSLCVCEITEIHQLSQSTASGHLKVLKEAELVDDEKDGLWVEYRLCRNNTFVSQILNLFLEALDADKRMQEERKAALQANRTVICKK